VFYAATAAISGLTPTMSIRALGCGRPKQSISCNAQRAAGYFDIRDLTQVLEHEGALPHPMQDKPQ
jgi:hypothetical protein